MAEKLLQVAGALTRGHEGGSTSTNHDEVLGPEEDDRSSFRVDDVAARLDRLHGAYGDVSLRIGTSRARQGLPASDVVPLEGGADRGDPPTPFENGLVDRDRGDRLEESLRIVLLQ